MRHLALLLALASTWSADPAVTATGSYPLLRRTRIAVAAPAQAGATAVVSAGGQELGRAVLGADGAGEIILPMPPPGHPLAGVTVAVGALPAVAAVLPDPDAARASALAGAAIGFHPAVFARPEFPACDFDDPRLVEDLIGPYRLDVAYYDDGYAAVTTAARPGRYGAVVTATGSHGEQLVRCVTIYRTPGSPNWWRERLGATATLPAATGIDPAVCREQSRLLDEFISGRFSAATRDGAPLPALLASLAATAPGSPPMPLRLSLRNSDADWWFPLRKRLGLAVHRYLTFMPAGYEADPARRFPLILFLHGSGERGLDLDLVRKHGPHRYWEGKASPFLIVAPQCDPGSWWTPAALDDLLDEVEVKLRVDRDRIYLTGLSMGGFGAWTLASTHPERFAAVVPICGGGDPGDVAGLAHKPIWVFHGGKDPTVPLASSQEMVDALRRSGGEPRFTVYPEAGHDSWTQAYATPELYDWMLQQHLH